MDTLTTRNDMKEKFLVKGIALFNFLAISQVWLSWILTYLRQEKVVIPIAFLTLQLIFLFFSVMYFYRKKIGYYGILTFYLLQMFSFEIMGFRYYLRLSELSFGIQFTDPRFFLKDFDVLYVILFILVFQTKAKER